MQNAVRKKYEYACWDKSTGIGRMAEKWRDPSIGPFRWLGDINDRSKPGIERVQALADISRSAICCHSNETRAQIANPPNSAQLKGTR